MAFEIVVGYDGSDGAKAALDEAIGLAEQALWQGVRHLRLRRPQDATQGAPLTPRSKLKELGARLLSRRSGTQRRTVRVPIETELVERRRSARAC